jgi:hypothetical protein
MPGILRRTIYIDDSKGYVRWFDVAKVETGLGTMWEGWTPFAYHEGMPATIDDTDMMRKVDKIERFDYRRYYRLCMNDVEQTVGGGVGYPRTHKI